MRGHLDDADERFAFEHPDERLRRREFLERTAAFVGASAAVAASLGPGALIAEAGLRQARGAALPRPRNMPIDTFVVLMMENRSFDHFLGWMPKADGRQAGLHYVDSKGVSHPTHALAPDYQGCGFNQPGHVWQQARVQFDGGKCDGFIADGSGNDTFALGYYRERDIPFLASAAKSFTTYDRYFASLLSSTNPNRSYAHAAQSYGDKYMFFSLPGDGERQFPTPKGFSAATTIEGRLAAKGLQGRTFFSDVNYASMWGPTGLRRSEPIAGYFDRAATGKLPTLSFVDPQLQGAKETAGLSNDQHPFSDIRTGDAFMADVVNAFMHSPQWRRGALFMVWDEWGGFFDHVRPPRVPDVRASSNINDDFGQMGFRTPAVLVSPYAAKGVVNHTQFGHESILKLVEYRFGLRPLTVRDARANNIGTSFAWRAKPRLRPPTLRRGPNVVSQACPAA